MTDATDRPTRRLNIVGDAQSDPEAANDAILDFAAQLLAKGERPWFEVWYEGSGEEDFDAVEVVDGEIVPLPEYADTFAWAELAAVAS